MDVILHVGAHRTGTTSLQSYMAQQRDRLLAQGCLALGPQVLRKGVFHDLLAHEASRAGLATAQRQMNADLDRASDAGLRSIVMSEENLIGVPRKLLAGGLLYSEMEATLRRLGPQLRLRVTRVGLAVRSYDSFWASLAAFGIQHNLHRPQAGQAEMWRAHCLAGGHEWSGHVATLMRLFPRAQVLVWRAEFAAPRPDDVLCHLVRGLQDLPDAAPHLNASQSPEALRERLIAKGALKAAALVMPMPRYSPFTPEDAAAMAARYHEDLARIAGMGGRVRLLARPADAAQSREAGKAGQTVKAGKTGPIRAADQRFQTRDAGETRQQKTEDNGARGIHHPQSARHGGERHAAIRWQNH